MNTIIRYVLLSIACSFFLGITFVLMTFLTFSLHDSIGWSALWEAKIGDVSFLLTLVALTITFGTVIGLLLLHVQYHYLLNSNFYI